MSKADELTLNNFFAYCMMRIEYKDEPVTCLWLCLDYKIRARNIRNAGKWFEEWSAISGRKYLVNCIADFLQRTSYETQVMFETWILRESIAREGRERNIPIP